MERLLFDLSRVLPEVFLFLSIILLFLYSAFYDKPGSVVTKYLAVFIVISVLYIVLLMVGVDAKVFNGMLRIEKFSTFIKILILSSTSMVLVLLLGSYARNREVRSEVVILMLISVLGMMFLSSAINFLSLYVSMEMMSLPLYILAASKVGNTASSEAGVKYFVLGSFASGLFLFGVSLIYGFTGSVDFETISSYYTTNFSDKDHTSFPIAILVGLIFVIVAFCFKVSAAPFHMWAPDVYQGSRTIITTFFASSVKIASMALFIRALYYGFYDLADQWSQIVIVVCVLSMIFGGFGAIVQKNIKRMLAYSSIGHVGFMLMGLVSADQIGIAGTVNYMMIYIFLTIGMFACVLHLTKSEKFKYNIDDMAGLAKNNPFLAFSISAFMFSMAGIPPLSGFFAKIWVLIPIIKNELFFVAGVAIIMSVVSAFYYIRIIKIMYFSTPSGGDRIDKIEFCTPIAVVLLVCTIFNLCAILAPHSVFGVAHTLIQ